MNETTLSAEEFKLLHNGLCELRWIYKELDLSTRTTERIDNALKMIDDALKASYQKDSEQFNRKNAHYESFKKAHKLDSIWSMYEVEDLSGFHPFPTVKQMKYDSGFSEFTVDIQGLHWADLWFAADLLISMSKDNHHVFIENFSTKDGYLYLQTGS